MADRIRIYATEFNIDPIDNCDFPSRIPKRSYRTLAQHCYSIGRWRF
jgi:hypothetical protein